MRASNMAQTKSIHFEQIGGRVPKKLADDFKKHAAKIRKSYTDLLVLVIEQYMASPASRLAVRVADLESQIGQLRWELRSVKKD